MAIDGLTGLPTHRELGQQLSASATPLAVFFDIDALVRLSDMHGWRSSDEAIIRVAHLIRDQAAALGCSAFRVGGDEFLVVLEGRGHERALAFARSTLSAVSAARIEYRRADDPSREHLAVNAAVCRVSARVDSNIAQAREWLADQIWNAKQGDIHRFEVIADAGDEIPPWA
jgi:diguanylate cyclase (GGDEF)-like protein